jgi:hypothetical protein
MGQVAVAVPVYGIVGAGGGGGAGSSVVIGGWWARLVGLIR